MLPLEFYPNEVDIVLSARKYVVGIDPSVQQEERRKNKQIKTQRYQPDFFVKPQVPISAYQKRTIN